MLHWAFATNHRLTSRIVNLCNDITDLMLFVERFSKSVRECLYQKGVGASVIQGIGNNIHRQGQNGQSGDP